MPKIRTRRQYTSEYREPSDWDRFWLVMCRHSPCAGGNYPPHASDYEAWMEWQRTREKRIAECIAAQPGTRPYAFWVWDEPEANAKRDRRERDHTLLYRFGLLAKGEEAAIRADKDRPPYLQLPEPEQPGEVIEMPERKDEK